MPFGELPALYNGSIANTSVESVFATSKLLQLYYLKNLLQFVFEEENRVAKLLDIRSNFFPIFLLINNTTLSISLTTIAPFLVIDVENVF